MESEPTSPYQIRFGVRCHLSGVENRTQRSMTCQTLGGYTAAYPDPVPTDFWANLGEAITFLDI